MAEKPRGRSGKVKSQILLESFFKDKTIFITGHTGFIGSWLSTWLHMLGSKVVGYALKPNTFPSMFETLSLDKKITSIFGDIRNKKLLDSYILESKPDIIIHLAAQPLVLSSYQNPVETIETNVMGTVNLLESVRKSSSVKVCINFTSDKCYDNRNLDYPYHENDPLGGHDPYSASKASSEIVTASYRKSFFGSDSAVNLASVRAGNVIGGGDWAENRIVPDVIRDLSVNKSAQVRNPDSIRPWQHVLEPISGLLWLSVKMWNEPNRFNEAWNFGPNSTMTVKELVNEIIRYWGSGSWVNSQANLKHEAKLLKLDCSKAKISLGWSPVYDVKKTIAETVAWYRNYKENNADIYDFTARQIMDYSETAKLTGLPWASTP